MKGRVLIPVLLHSKRNEFADAIISSPPDSKMCQCGYTFAELGEAAMRRMKLQDQEEAEARMREACGSSGLEDGMGNLKLEMERGASSSSPR